MKMKKSLLSVVFLLATSSAMAAMSYTSASVTSDMVGTVTSTNSALLALDEGSGKASWLDDNVLKIDFDKGLNSHDYGLQKQSEYTWDNIFTIKNNSENKVNVTVKNEHSLPAGVELFIKKDGNWVPLNQTGVQFLNVDQVAAKSMDLKVKVAKTSALGTFTPNLIVSGNAVTSTGGNGNGNGNGHGNGHGNGNGNND